MKQNRSRTILALVLSIISISSWADTADRIVIAEMQNGVIAASTITGAGEQTVTLTVTPAENYYIDAEDIIVSKTGGSAQARNLTPGYADKLTVTVVSADGRGAGTYQVTVPDGYGAYVEASFTPCIAITPQVTITGWTYGAYDATANKPTVTGNTGNGTETFAYATKGSDNFSATVPENTGDYTIKASIAASGHYLAGEATADFTISKAAGSISYQTASVSKTFGEADFTNELTIVGDGTVSYTSDKPAVATVDATTGKVTIAGSGTANITATVTDGKNYIYATKTASYTLAVGTATMDVTATGYEGVYDQKEHNIIVSAPKSATVKYGETEGSYTLDTSPTYINAGTYTVYYQATMENYTTVSGSQKVIITAKAIAETMIDAINTQIYTGKELKPTVTIKDGESLLAEGTDYTLDYTDNINVGIAKVTISGKGNYNGTASATFTILANKEELLATISTATDYYKEIEEKYGSIAATLKEAIDAAKAIADNKDATQKETDAAKEALTEAIKKAKEDVEIANDINSIETDLRTGVWYDINGRKLKDKPTSRGVYIINGQKYIIR